LKLFTDTLIDDELRIEHDSVKSGVARYKRLVKETEGRGEGASLKASERLLVYWFKAFRRRVRKERRACEKRQAGIGRGVYGQYMRILDTSQATVIAMHTVLGICLTEPAGIHTTKVVLAIGRNLCAHMARKRFKHTDHDSWNALMHANRKQAKPRDVLKVARKFFPDEVWPLRVQGKIGGTLLKLLTGVATVPDATGHHHPAFDIYDVRRGRRTYYYIRLTPEADKIIRDGHAYRQVLRPTFQPMVVRPLAWTQDNPGGYLSHKVPIIKRLRRHRTNVEVVNDTVLSAVNVLGATPWRINKRILKVAQALRDQGGNVPGIPRMTKIEPPPVPPDFTTNIDARKAWKREAAIIHGRNVGLKGERVVAWHKLDIADRFKDYERIYFPHDLDFRGRAYALPLFLNHQGDDLCRGLLEFAEAKSVSMDDSAKRWLGVHMANCCGVDKVSLDDRDQWARDNRHRFLAWSMNPLDCSDWLEVDKPFQALATAFAMHDLPDAASRLPIQVDGSNNALQHYGAMLRCPVTAAMVNLVPGDMPADVYADVAESTRQLVAADAAADHSCALKLEGWITRKVVKQTVMTSVYGVTAVGARRQIHEWLVKAGFVDRELYNITKYLGGIARKALARVCAAAYEAMLWLTKCARLIARDKRNKKKEIVYKGQTVRWATPLGMRVEQPYRDTKSFRIDTILHRLQINEVTNDAPPRTSRQINGFAPNFVHSIDGAHMMLTANSAHEADIAFAQVFDSFWTHAADMDTLSRLLRESFVKLHEVPLLGDLYRQMQAEYPDRKFPPPPETGDFDVRQVLDSDYSFS